MTDLLWTMHEVVVALRAEGLSPRQARIGSAIAMCEAPGPVRDGHPTSNFALVGDQALANDVWGFSYGGFQVRSLRADKGTGLLRDEERLVDPEFNCWAARKIRATAGWKAWSTYTSGMYKAYLPDLYPPPPNTYTVLAGDTLTEIAQRYDMTWADLARLNGLHDPYTIYIGQHLLLG